VNLRLRPEDVVRLATEVGITFCFAPDFHPAMRHAAGPRRQLGIPTVFNALGPLTNPALPTTQAVGVADPRLAPPIAGVLEQRGCPALVFRGDDGLDELTVTTTSRVWSVTPGGIREELFDPREVGIPLAPAAALLGGGPAVNAAVVRRLLSGERGPVRDAVLLSAAAVLAADMPSSLPVAERLRPALAVAAESVDSGAAGHVLDRWVRTSQSLADAAAA
jgi:anthranilate phosphoribosyltransferase